MARRKPLRVGLALVSFAVLGGCVVPANRYEDARSALNVERDAHRQTHARAYDLERQLLQARSDLDARAQELAERDRLLAEHGKLLAQVELDLAVSTEEHEGAVAVVEQLRSDLERVGTHLRDFAAQKADLENALDAAEARASDLADAARQAARRAGLMRDLALALHGPVGDGVVSLRADGGKPTIRMPVERVYADGAKEIAPEARAVVRAVAAMAIASRGTRLELRETDAAGDPGVSTDLIVRLERLSEALVEDGVPLGDVVMAAPAVRDDTTQDQPAAAGDERQYVEITLVTNAA